MEKQNFRAEVIDNRFLNAVSETLDYTVIAEGFRFLEGPVWHEIQKKLYFSDIPGNAIYSWSEAEGVKLYRQNSYLANGNTIDDKGRIITCEHGTSRVTMTEPDGTYIVLVDAYNGMALNSPNDVVVKSDGSIYFTDPNPGRCSRVGIPRPQKLPFQGVYRLNMKNGELTLLADDFLKPNGLCFSLDESKLFVNDTDRGHIRVFDAAHDGTLKNGMIWTILTGEGPGVADGMKMTEDGLLWCAGPGGIHVFDETGRCIGIIHIPEVAANFAWGGDDMRTLYIAATSKLIQLKTLSKGIIRKRR